MKIKTTFVLSEFRYIFQYILIIALLLDANSIYFYLKSRPTKWYYILLMLFFVGILTQYILEPFINARKAKKATIATGIFLWYTSIYLVLQNYMRYEFFKMMIIVTVLIFYMLTKEESDSVPKIILQYKNFIFVIACISLFFWIFGSMLGIISPSGIVHSIWTMHEEYKEVNNYYFLYFESQKISDFPLISGSFCRNTAIFTEAPMASLHFSLAFLIELLIERKADKIKKIILLIAILSTMSTTGYCVLIILALLKFIFHKTDNQYIIILKKIILPAIMFIGVIILFYFIQEKLGTGSGALRIDDYIVCLKTWLQRPILGYGIKNNTAIVANMDFWRNTAQGLSNSPGQILAHGGIYIFSLYVFCITKGLVRATKVRDDNMITFMILFIFIFATTIISYRFLTFLFLIWFATYQGKSKNFSKDKFMKVRNSLD